jgi:hypothetical protein
MHALQMTTARQCTGHTGVHYESWPFLRESGCTQRRSSQRAAAVAARWAAARVGSIAMGPRPGCRGTGKWQHALSHQ